MPEDDEKEKRAVCEKQKDEYLAGWQRAKADFLNYKKEELQRLQEFAKYGHEELMRELISVLDSFDLGIAALEKAGPIEKGIYMIKAQIEDVTRRHGMERIKISPGDAMNPLEMESIGEMESTMPPGTVAEEIERGYRLHEKVIRPARVKIAKQTGGIENKE